MSSRLLWGVPGGGALGVVIGYFSGNTAIGVAVCAVAGAVAACVWHFMGTRTMD